MARITPEEFLQKMKDQGMSDEEAAAKANEFFNNSDAQANGTQDAAKSWLEEKLKDYGVKAAKDYFGPSSGASGIDAGYEAAADYGSGAVQGAEAAMEGPTIANASGLPEAGSVGLWPLAGAYAGLKGYQGAKNILKGRDLSLQQQAALSIPTFGASFAYNPIKNALKSGKDSDQLNRDSIRKMLGEAGIDDQNYGLKLADNKTYDIGRDNGSPVGTYSATGGARQSYQVDFNDPRSGMVAGWATPLAQLMSGGKDRKSMTDIGGFITNGAMSTSTDLEGARKNILAILKNMGITSDQAIEELHKQKDAGILDQNQLNAMSYSIGTLNSGNYGKTVVPSSSLKTPLPDVTPKPLNPVPTSTPIDISKLHNIDPGYTRS